MKMKILNDVSRTILEGIIKPCIAGIGRTRRSVCM